MEDNLLFSLIAGLIAVPCGALVFWDMIPGLQPRRKKRKQWRPLEWED